MVERQANVINPVLIVKNRINQIGVRFANRRAVDFTPINASSSTS
jgi:hypothetical protein